MTGSVGRSLTSIDLRDIIYRDNPRTLPALLPANQIAALIEYAKLRLETVAREAGLAVISGDTSNDRFLASLTPYTEEAAHLRYVIEFLADHSAGGAGTML